MQKNKARKENYEQCMFQRCMFQDVAQSVQIANDGTNDFAQIISLHCFESDILLMQLSLFQRDEKRSRMSLHPD